MAEKQHTSNTDTGNSTGSSAPFKVPTLAIPDDTQCGADGWPGFTIGSPGGPITAKCIWKSMECLGSLDALVAAGLMLPEWAPGLLGNNTTQQSVAFEADGPRLILGNPRGKRLTVPQIAIRRVSRRSLAIRLQLTVEQQEWVRAKCAEAKNGAPVTPESAHIACCKRVEIALGWVRFNLEDPGHTYTHEAMSRIRESYNGLCRAVADGRKSPAVPKYHREGNVIHFPRVMLTQGSEA